MIPRQKVRERERERGALKIDDAVRAAIFLSV